MDSLLIWSIYLEHGILKICLRMIANNQKFHKELGVLQMKKVRHYFAGSIFAALGIIFLYLEVTPTMDHTGHGMQMDHNPNTHAVKLLGIGEMTWM